MPSVIGRALSEWEHGKYVFFDEGKLSGRSSSVSGLAEIAQLASRPGGAGFDGYPELDVAALDEDLATWMRKAGQQPREFYVRDNVRKKWVTLTGWVRNHGELPTRFSWAINRAEVSDEKPF